MLDLYLFSTFKYKILPSSLSVFFERIANVITSDKVFDEMKNINLDYPIPNVIHICDNFPLV